MPLIVSTSKENCQYRRRGRSGWRHENPVILGGQGARYTLGAMLAELKELWRFRELLVSMVERELKIRYKNSLFGFLWSLIVPLVTVVVMTLVFKYFLRNATDNFSAYVLAAYLPYMFFQLALLDSAQSVLLALPLVRKIYFPRELLPLSLIIGNFIHFVLALIVFFAYLLFVWIRHPQVWPFRLEMLWLPVLLAVNLCLVTGLGLLFSALNTFYEDVKYFLSVTLYVNFFLCPVMYFSEDVRYSVLVPERYRELVYTLYHLNPIAMLCTAYRKILVAPGPILQGKERIAPMPMDWGLFGVTALISVAVLWFGYWTFNRLKWRFVERP